MRKPNGDPIKTYKLSRKTILNIGGVVKLILGKQVRMTYELDDFDTLNWPTNDHLNWPT